MEEAADGRSGKGGKTEKAKRRKGKVAGALGQANRLAGDVGKITSKNAVRML